MNGEVGGVRGEGVEKVGGGEELGDEGSEVLGIGVRMEDGGGVGARRVGKGERVEEGDGVFGCVGVVVGEEVFVGGGGGKEVVVGGEGVVGGWYDVGKGRGVGVRGFLLGFWGRKLVGLGLFWLGILCLGGRWRLLRF